jgi:hypothetical protein
MQDTLDSAITAFVSEEEQRLVAICAAADRYGRERKEQLRGHHQKIRVLKAERLNSNNPREIDKITFEIENLSHYDPAKYLVPFEQMGSPYLAGIAICDDDPKIGRRHILLGKQSLMVGSKVMVTDWRKAQISKLYYEWEEGEEYEDDIGDGKSTKTISAIGSAAERLKRRLLTASPGANCSPCRPGPAHSKNEMVIGVSQHNKTPAWLKRRSVVITAWLILSP